MSSISSTPLRFFSVFSRNNQLLRGVKSFAAKMWLNTVQLQTMEIEYDLKSVCNVSRRSRTLVVSANKSSDLDGKDWNQISIFSNIKCYLRCVYHCNKEAKLTIVTIATTCSIVLFQAGVLFSIEKAKFWPILAILSQIFGVLLQAS